MSEYEKYQIYFNDNAFYVALIKKLLVGVISLDINLLAKNYPLKRTI